MFRTDEFYSRRKLTFKNQYGTRKLGRTPSLLTPPYSGWIVLKKTLKEVDLTKNWKTKEANRMQWICVVGAVKARTRLWHQYGDYSTSMVIIAPIW